jgi:hypothetical protein
MLNQTAGLFREILFKFYMSDPCALSALGFRQTASEVSIHQLQIYMQYKETRRKCRPMLRPKILKFIL